LAGLEQPHIREADADGGNLSAAGIQGHMLLREERNLLRGAVAFARKKIDRLLPGSLLATVEFSEIENMALENPAAGNPPVFDDAPVMVLFAILVAFFAAKKHDLHIKAVHAENVQGGRSALQALLETTPL
jgi:hypothetical protein